MLKVERFYEYAYVPSGVVFNSRSGPGPIMWDGAEKKAVEKFDAWRKTVKKERIVNVTGPTHQVIESGCGVVEITVMYEGDE